MRKPWEVALVCLILLVLQVCGQITLSQTANKIFGGMGKESSAYGNNLLPLLDSTEQYYFSCVDSRSSPFFYESIFVNTTAKYTSPVILKWNKNTLQLVWAKVLDYQASAFCLGLSIHSNLLHVTLYDAGKSSNFNLLALHPETGNRISSIAPKNLFPNTFTKFPMIPHNNTTNVLAIAGKTYKSDPSNFCSQSPHTFGLYVALLNSQTYQIVNSVCISSANMDQEVAQMEQDAQGNIYILGYVTDATVLLVNTGQLLNISNTTTAQASALIMKFSSNLEFINVQVMRSTSNYMNPLFMKLHNNKLYALVRFQEQIQVDRFFIRSAVDVTNNQAIVRLDASTLQVEWFQELAPSDLLLCKAITLDPRDGHLLLAMDVEQSISVHLMNQLPLNGLQIGSVVFVKIHSTSATVVWHSILFLQQPVSIYAMIMDTNQLIVSGAVNKEEYTLMVFSNISTLEQTSALLPPIGYSLLSLETSSNPTGQILQESEELFLSMTNSSLIQTANTENGVSLVPLEISYQNLQFETFSQTTFSNSFAVYGKEKSIIGQVIGNGFGITVNRLKPSVSLISDTYLCVQSSSHSKQFVTNSNYIQPSFAKKRISGGFETVSASSEVIKIGEKVCGKIGLAQNEMIFPAMIDTTGQPFSAASTNNYNTVLLFISTLLVALLLF